MWANDVRNPTGNGFIMIFDEIKASLNRKKYREHYLTPGIQRSAQG
jgi:hypothetical protein